MRKISVLLLFVAFLGCAKEKQQPSKPIDPKRKQLAEAVATNPDSSLDLKEKARLENLRIEMGGSDFVSVYQKHCYSIAIGREFY
jgi:hypothetical protein